MGSPLVFRIVFGFLFLLMFVVVTRYRMKAQSGRKIDYSNEGWCGLPRTQAWWPVGLDLLPAIHVLPSGA